MIKQDMTREIMDFVDKIHTYVTTRGEDSAFYTKFDSDLSEEEHMLRIAKAKRQCAEALANILDKFCELKQ